MTPQTGHRHIGTGPGILCGEPTTVVTRTSVRAIVELWQMGIPPEEIPNRLPHIRIAQVFDALSCYSDHTNKIHDFITRNQVGDADVDPLVRED